MLKRALIFILLLGLGFFLLSHFVANGDGRRADHATENGRQQGRPADPLPQGPSRPLGPGIQTGQEPGKSPVAIVPGSSGEIPRLREIRLPNGQIRQVHLYRLAFGNSRTEADNKLVLEDVTIDFFATDETSDPIRSVRTGRLTASRARVQLSQDENQVADLAEDKLMEFWDAVYVADQRASGGSLEVALGHAKVLNTEDQLHLWTPDETEPVRISTTGEDGITITGKGLDAWVPTERDQRGAVQPGRSGDAVLEVLHEPVLRRRHVELTATGKLVLKQATTGSVIRITMQDEVRMSARLDDDEGGERTTEARTLRGSGDTLLALLTRSEAEGDPTEEAATTRWLHIRLDGSPARLEDSAHQSAAPAAERRGLECARLLIYPDADGEPVWVTALHGGGWRPTLHQRLGGEVSTFRCEERVHVVQIRRQHGALLGGFGIPMLALPTELEQLVIFEGAAEMTSSRDALRVQASDGLALMRSGRPELRDFLVVEGKGAVRIQTTMLVAEGNRGFSLRQHLERSGKEPAIVRALRLGPGEPRSSHVYHLARKPGVGGEAFDVRGSGLCDLRLRGDRPERLRLFSPDEDIAVGLPSAAGRLWQVRELDARATPDADFGALEAVGSDCLLAYRVADGMVHGRGQRLRLPHRDRYLLAGSPAVVEHEQHGRLSGEEIDARRLHAKDFVVSAWRGARLRARRTGTEGPDAAGPTVEVDIDADAIHILPFLIPPQAWAPFASVLPPGPAPDSASPHLLALGRVTIHYDIARPGSRLQGTGTGDELALRADQVGRAFLSGRLSNDRGERGRRTPAELTVVDEQGQRTRGRAFDLLFFLEPDASTVTLHAADDHLPELLLDHGTDRGQTNALGSAGPVQMVCDGAIVLAPREVRFDGPVRIRGLDPQGNVDGQASWVDADRLHARRSERGGLDGIDADEEVRFSWQGAAGQCRSLSVDVPTTTLRVRGSQAQPASVRLGARELDVLWLNYDYRTRMSESWGWHAEQAWAAR